MTRKVFTGTDGKFRFNDQVQPRTSAWSIEASVNLLEKTSLGQKAATTIAGVKSYTGSATILYYKDDVKITDVLNKIFKEGDVETYPVEFNWGTKKITFDAYVTSATIAVAPGEVGRAELTFTAEGDLTNAVL
tara:strand:+ start:438 stop:836 length:399 start_codon:yes stop_codon:yes gene_type:complete